MDLYKVPRASLGHEGGSVIRGREGKVSVFDTPQLPEPPKFCLQSLSLAALPERENFLSFPSHSCPQRLLRCPAAEQD